MTPDEQRYNEQAKLLATWYNSTSIAILVAGVVAPAVGFLFDIRPIALTWLSGTAVVFWLSVCVALRIQARLELQRLIFDEPV